METILNSFFLVFVGEMGDKTQLLSLVLVARFRRPWLILAGVLIATLANHAIAAWIGDAAASLMEPNLLKWILAGIFFVFAIWLLIPDKEEELKEHAGLGVFMTTVVSFFLAEMGDKTQLATVALAARYSEVVVVTIGTTLGMLASNALAIFLGTELLKKVPMKWVRIAASLIFMFFGVGILLAKNFGL